MSNDLISRSALIKEIQDEISFNDECYGLSRAISIVEEQPAAYDKDKVVEQLKEIINLTKTCNSRGRIDEFGECDNKGCWECILERSIEIVKGAE